MRVVVTTESRFLRTPDGRVWVQIGPDHSTWRHYLPAFTEVRLVARVLDVARAPDGARRVDGDGVTVWPVPYYLGPKQYARRWWAVRRAVIASAADADGFILRVPSVIGNLLAGWLDRRHRPYALEVIGDPHEVFAPGAIRHPLRPLLRSRFSTALRRQCAHAVAIRYETERSLQERYPARPGTPAVGISSVELPTGAFVPKARVYPTAAPGALLSVGSLEQMYKGVDVLIEAVALLARRHTGVRLVHVGVGACRAELERLAIRLGVADRVTFAGWLPSVQALRAEFDRADVFVMPSRTEGLPRVLVEAMARGLPAVGTTAGGIPELLPPERLAAPGDPVGLADAIGRLLPDPELLSRASARNLDRARAFSPDVLTPRFDAFYRAAGAALVAPAGGDGSRTDTPDPDAPDPDVPDGGQVVPDGGQVVPRRRRHNLERRHVR